MLRKSIIYLAAIFMILNFIISSPISAAENASQPNATTETTIPGGELPPMMPMPDGGPMDGVMMHSKDGKTNPAELMPRGDMPDGGPMGGPMGDPGMMHMVKHGDQNGKYGKVNPAEFLKKLTAEQRNEARKLMMLTKSYNDMATLCSQKNDVNEAVAYINKIINMKVPTYFPKDEFNERKKIFSMRIVELYVKAGKDDLAIAEAEKLMALTANDIEMSISIYNRLAQLYKAKGNLDKAGLYMKKSIELLEKDLK